MGAETKIGPSSSLYLAMDSIHAVTKRVMNKALFLYQGCSTSSRESLAPEAEVFDLDNPRFCELWEGKRPFCS